MTEAEWLASDRPGPMLRHLRPLAGPRPLRLFAFSCWRRVAHLLPGGPFRWLLGLLEPFADGRVGPEELLAAKRAAWDAVAALTLARMTASEGREHLVASRLVRWGAHEGAMTAARQAARTAREAARRIGEWALAAESKAQCDLLREVFGNPFRPVARRPEWLAWEGGTALKLAQAIYDERAFDRLPILADALEEAGCNSADLLAHCRADGPHARGCWAVDCVLGRREGGAP